MANAWSALSDGTRREILSLLKRRPHTAGEISDQFDLTAATVSHHLSVLKENGLITAQKRAQTIIYSLNPALLREMVKTLSSYIGK